MRPREGGGAPRSPGPVGHHRRPLVITWIIGVVVVHIRYPIPVAVGLEGVSDHVWGRVCACFDDLLRHVLRCRLVPHFGGVLALLSYFIAHTPPAPGAAGQG